MTPIYAILGVLLVLVSIPLGLMLAPLIVGGILIWVGVKRSHRSIQPDLRGGAA